MQVVAISTPRNSAQAQLLLQQHRLRADVFCKRLGWDVSVEKGMERDNFDDLAPTYIIATDNNGRVTACARLLPAVGPTMVETVFPSLLPDGKLCAHTAMIESSRFCVDTGTEQTRSGNSIHETTRAMFAAIIEWSLLHGFSEIVTVTDLRFERILARVGWPLRRLGSPQKIGVTTAVAGMLSTDWETSFRLRPDAYNSSLRTGNEHRRQG